MKKKLQPVQVKKFAVFLEITHMRYSIGGEHYYGKLTWHHFIRNPKGVGHPNGGSYDSHEIEIKHPMSAKLAKYLNKKDSAYFSCARYKPGSLTERFDTPEEVIKAGVEEFKKIPGENILIRGQSGHCSAVPLLAWPIWFVKEAKRINELAEEWKKIGGYGSSWGANKEGNPKRAEEIDEEWGKLVAPFGI